MADAKDAPPPGKLAVVLSFVTAPFLVLTPVIAALEAATWLKDGKLPVWTVDQALVWLGLTSEKIGFAGLQAVFDALRHAPLIAALPALGAAGAAVVALASKPPKPQLPA